MIICRKELLEAAENGTLILNHLDELAEDAMKAIFFEKVPICEGSISTKPLISPSKERVLTKKWDEMNMSFTMVPAAAVGK